ncbi:MAG: hypothetical protein ACOH12_12180 [Parvibaculaceae bacterium]
MPGVIPLAWWVGVVGSLATGFLGLCSILLAGFFAPSEAAASGANGILLSAFVVVGPFVMMPLGLVCAVAYLKLMRPLLIRVKLISEI